MQDMLTGTNASEIGPMNQTMHNAGFNSKMERLARGGVNTVMLYGIAQLSPRALSAMLADFEVVGIHVMFQMVEQVVPLLLPDGNTSSNWAAFTGLVNAVKDSPALLGYYVRRVHGTCLQSVVRLN